MKILYVIMAYGPQIIASEVHSELGREFRRAGHHFAVLSLDDYTASGEAGSALFEGEEGVVPLYTIAFRNSRWRRLGRRVAGRLFHYAFFVELVLGLTRFLRRYGRDFDLAHVEAAYPLGAAWSIAARLAGNRRPFVLNLQGADVMSLPRYDYGYGRFAWPRRLLRLAFRRCAGVRANSEQTAELARRYGADPARVRVIYRNISDTIYPPPATDLAAIRAAGRELLRRKYNLRSGPVVMAYSRLHPFKGLDDLLRAVPRLLQDWPDLNVLICGPSRRTPQFGDYRQYLERLAAELGISDRVIFTGQVDFSLSGLHLAGADLLVVPSVVEALNKVVIEAAAAGTPSVITDTTGIAPAAVRGGVGLAVPASDPAGLAAGIARLLSDPDLRAVMGARGPGWAADFSSQAVAARLLDFYRSVTQPPADGLCYVAYPSSLTLKSANSIQTFSTCRELKRLAPDTLVLLPRLPGRASRFEEIGAVHLPRLPFNFFNNFKPLRAVPWSYVERTFFSLEVALLLLARRLAGRGVGVVYVRDVICAYWLTRWRRLLGIRVVYEAHDLEARNPSRARSPRLRRWLERVDRTVVGRSDRLVSLTGAFLDYLADAGWRGPADGGTAVIPDAYDDRVYRPLSDDKRLAARREFGLEPQSFVVVYSGLTFAYRSLDKLVEAWRRFLEAHPNLPGRLVFAGGRPFEREALMAQARQAGIEDRVECAGQQPPERVNLYLNAASLLAIPDTVTDLTASPLKMFEYAAVARPVMLPDLPALKEILPEDEAVYFERGSIEGMQAALEWVCANPAAAEQRARAACRRVARYTYANRAQAILDTFAFIAVRNKSEREARSGDTPDTPAGSARHP